MRWIRPCCRRRSPAAPAGLKAMWCIGVITISPPWLARPDAETAEATHRATSLGRVWPSAVSRLVWRPLACARRRSVRGADISPTALAAYGTVGAVLDDQPGGVLCRPLHGALCRHRANRGVSDPRSPRRSWSAALRLGSLTPRLQWCGVRSYALGAV